jgi:hypothetical protein
MTTKQITEKDVKKLWCVSHYGTYDLQGHFDSYLGDGITRAAERLVAVFDTKAEAKEMEKEILADEDDYRVVTVQRFDPSAFFSRQTGSAYGKRQCCADVIKEAGEDDEVWQSSLDPEDARSVYEERTPHNCWNCGCQWESEPDTACCPDCGEYDEDEEEDYDLYADEDASDDEEED